MADRPGGRCGAPRCNLSAVKQRATEVRGPGYETQRLTIGRSSLIFNSPLASQSAVTGSPDVTEPSRQDWSTWERLASRRLLTHSIQHDGETRTALLYVPRHVTRPRVLPLVLVFHGGASSPEKIARSSAMHRIAEREGFIVAYPAGTRVRRGLSWSVGGREDARRTGDARFVRNLIHDLKRRYEIDPARIYAAGFSIGGSLVYEVACRLAEQIAAIAVVGGAMTAGVFDPVRPVPLIHIHGTKDRRVPMTGGRGPATPDHNEWLPVQHGIDHWCRINRCSGSATVIRHAVQGVTAYHHSGAADVELWLVEGGYHAWPGGLAASESDDPLGLLGNFSASEKIWSFFAARPASLRPSPRFTAATAGSQPETASTAARRP